MTFLDSSVIIDMLEAVERTDDGIAVDIDGYV